MNKLRFKLVFSKRLGMLVPIAEISRTHQKTVTLSGAADTHHQTDVTLRPLWRISTGSLALVLAGCLSWMSAPLMALDGNTLPVEYSGGGYTLPPGVSIPTPVNNTMNITTTIQNAVIRWDSFSIGANATVNFKMPDPSSSVLNRVMGDTASTILGTLTANGHVYIVNHNGIYFGAGSQVNVGSLTATTLDNVFNNSIEDVYNRGILSNQNEPVFSFADAVGIIEVAGDIIDEKGQVVKKAAQIETKPNGRVMLLAPDVKNSGVISTPDGQTLLAAGKTIYMAKQNENILVEVSSGGTVKNIGKIVVGNGNASLVGLAVNQEGRITATTSVRNNGKILLKAEEIQSKGTPANNRLGTVTLAKNSTTEVLVDTANTEEAVVAQKVGEKNQSIVEVLGKTIDIQGHITANAGQVNVTANSNGIGESRIFLGENAVIDVSGVDANAAMSRNQLKIQLYSEQLKDSPVLRGGPLFGEFLYLDAREGTPIISQAVIEQAKQAQKETIAEAMTNGGSVSFTADSVVTKAGSVVNTSGGKTTYAAGDIKESKLLFNGKWVDASDAQAGVAYESTGTTYSIKDPRWGTTRTWDLSSSPDGKYQAGYVEGGSAGSFKVSSSQLALQGDLIANTTVGTYQRGDTANSSIPKGGELNINFNGNSSLNFVSQLSDPLNSAFNANSELSDQQKAVAEIDTRVLRQGVSRLEVKSANGQMNINTQLQVQPKGSIVLDANGGLNVNANITVAGGNVTLSASERTNVVLAKGVNVSTSGLLTNDNPGISGAMTGSVVKDAGNITVTDGLVLKEGARLEANAGAWIKQDKTTETGHGGDINVTLAQNKLENSAFSAYGIYDSGKTSQGGKLTINLQGDAGTSPVKDIQIGGVNPDKADTLWLDEGFFGRGGFSNYALSNERRLDGDIAIGQAATTTLIQPQQSARVLNASAQIASSGSTITDVSSVTTPPSIVRSPVSLSMRAGDDLTLHEGATIVTQAPNSKADLKGNVSLTSKGQMTILGDITAPAADITLTVQRPDEMDPIAPNKQFDPSLSLFVGEKSVLSARGQYIAPPTVDRTLRNAKVLDAGHIIVKSGNGVVILKEGSQLDVSAASGLVDLQTSNSFVRQQVDGNAGTIEIEARDGLALDGSLTGKSAGQGEAGTLKVVLGGDTWSATENDSSNPLFLPNGKRLLTVTQSKQVMASSNQPGGNVGNLIETTDPDMPLTKAVGKGQLSQAQITEGGFDHVQLQVKNASNSPDSKIVLESGTTLSAPSSIALDATAIAGAGRIQASTVSLQNSTSVTLDTPAAGQGELVVDANFIDLVGHVALDQVSSVKLNSRSDIRGRGIANGLQSVGSLTVADKLVLDAAQVYPVSAANFNITANGAQSRVEIMNSQGVKPAVPMSAQGKLNINANEILQSGNLRAPLGEINLNAKERLVLGKNSLTSVSAEGSVIPYLTTVLGGNSIVEQEGNEQAIGKNKLNEKKITLNASNIDLQGGAKVDISGGGDTLSYEWLPGIGGSEHVLAKQGYYAVLPKLGQQYAPYDYLMYGANISDVNVGKAIYLAGGNGLSAGTYTLLPARYALVPGAYLVKVSSDSVPINTSLAQLDGSTNMSGYFTRLDGTSRGQFASFNVMSGQVFYNDAGTKDYKGPAEYLVTLGNQFFINKARQDGTVTPQLSADAGQLSISATSQLNLDGQIVAQKPSGAKGGLVDISSNKIQVVSNVGAVQDGVLQLSAKQLSNIQADSVLLGGSRSVSGNTQTITTQASEVTFANDANHVVENAELIVSAKDKLSVKSGAVIKTTAAAAKPGNVTLNTSGDGALLAVSSSNDLSLNRTGANGTGGELEIEQGTRVDVARSAVLDGTKVFDKSGDVNVANGGSLTLGSQQFALGDSNPNAATRIDAVTLQSYGQLSSVTLNSYKQIDIYGAVDFGSNNLNLRLNSSGLAHHGDGSVVINAKTLTLSNTLGNSFVTPQDIGTSQLTLNTENTVFGAGNQLNIDGFDQVNVNAAQQIKFADTGKVNINAVETNLRSAVVTADTGAKYDLSTTGALNLLNNGNTAAATTGLGANVALTSRATTIANRVEMLAGQFKATSTNADLTVAAGGQVVTKAATVQFDQTHSKTTNAGNVTLVSNTGSVVVAENALIDVSGGQQAGDAGSLTVEAKRGQFTVADGTLKANAPSKQKRGQFNLDVNQLDNFSDVNRALESGQFNEARDIRVRSGNVDIQATDTVTAKQFSLGVDNGNIQVAGTVNADGDKGGDVAMYASGTVILKNTAKITARGTQANQASGDLQTGSGGKVLLSSNSLATTNAVSAETGALIDVSGYDKAANNNIGVNGADGSVTLRGRRGASGTANTVNVAFNTTGAIKGANEVRVEGVRTYTATTFANTIAGLVADTNSFYTANPDAGTYLNTQDGLAAQILPYIEVRSTTGNTATNMTSSADHNLRAFGTGVNALIAGRGGVLALRSSGDLSLNSISDGFSTALANTGVLQDKIKTFDLNFVAGADYTSANVNKTVAGTGNLTLANNKIIRTGEGDITVSAGNNITLGTGVIYTVGKADIDAVGFTKPSAATAASYVNNGGDIHIEAQGNISGTATTQSVNQWLLRQASIASSETDTSWWVRPDLFQQGVAALGGGDVNITAGGNITNVSASSATNAQFDNRGANATNNSVVKGGGDVSVSAGGNVTNGVYYVGRGKLSLDANGDIGKSGGASSQGLLIALQDASANVSANGNVKVDTVFNPTLWAQGATNSSNRDQNNYFNTYSSDSSFDVSSLVGNVQVGLQHRDNISSTGLSAAATALKNHDYGAIHPATVNATAFSGDVTSYKMILTPANNGRLQVMAANNITAVPSGVNSSSTGGQSPTGTVIISDADVISQFTIDNPVVGNANESALSNLFSAFKTGSSATPVHKIDNNQSVIIAKDGSISFKGAPSANSNANVYGLKSSMPVYISAGGDVTMHASIQHNNPGDISIVKAGNDFVMELPNANAEFVVHGPGDLLIEAARNINLGKTNGILSVANTINANLPENGANITMLAGLGKDGAAINEFVNAYINPNGTGPSAIAGDPGKLSVYRTVVAGSVKTYMENRTGQLLSEQQAMQMFLALSVDEQKPLAYAMYGIEMTNAIVDYVQTGKAIRGEELIASMFPKTRAYEGDILMYQSQVKTLRFADINLLTPGGLINAGVPLATTSTDTEDTAKKEIGIVTEKGGALRVYADKGFEINQSKVSTLFGVKGGGSDQDGNGNLLGVRGKGSDLSAWVNNGDIDAGRGSKTALAVPERLGKLDDFGNRIVELKGVAAGSGISTSTYDPDGPAGNQKEVKAGVVFLAAPNGVLDAGEAGVSSGADLFVGAQVINNATNISAAGSSSGVPVADTGGLAGAALSATNTSAGASNALTENIANQMNNQNVAPKELPPIVTVKTIRLED